ncbi:sigma 54-interacting transcriptional regulator [Candidatus Pantoea carbekii]|uniref:sigma 54-interacting transcriptional regulator n=1 Tax=Candidatus Pantoea carbekii TaxID=1235990 RepID=UPI0038995E65
MVNFIGRGIFPPIGVDARMILTTHQNTKLYIKEDKFRENLFYHFNIILYLSCSITRTER